MRRPRHAVGPAVPTQTLAGASAEDGEQLSSRAHEEGILGRSSSFHKEPSSSRGPSAPRATRSGESDQDASLAEVAQFVAHLAEQSLLSPREGAVLCLAAGGAKPKEIAFSLKCSPKTIDTYWTRIFLKTGIKGKEQVLAHVLRAAVGRVAESINVPGSTKRHRGTPDRESLTEHS